MYKTIVKPIIHTYKKLSPFGKILIILVLFLIIMYSFRSLRPSKEGFTVSATDFTFKSGNVQIYDNFYADIYDYLVFNNVKNVYEINQIVDNTKPTEESYILDIGSGTGHHVKNLSDNGYKAIGIDSSPAMIKKAKENYPDMEYQNRDVLASMSFPQNTFTHITCLYFTLYYIKDKRMFFNNCMNWLKSGGYLVVHLVDREKFDPILPPGNPLYIVSPQKYAKERITTTKITFNDFVYNSDFKFDKSANIATFDERFKFNNGNVRKQEQKLYMEDTQDILTTAQQCGFILQGKIDLVNCAYENQYLYILVKPN